MIKSLFMAFALTLFAVSFVASPALAGSHHGDSHHVKKEPCEMKMGDKKPCCKEEMKEGKPCCCQDKVKKPCEKTMKPDSSAVNPTSAYDRGSLKIQSGEKFKSRAYQYND